MDALEILARGGSFLLPIGVASVLGLALFFERLVYLRYSRIAPPQLSQAVRRLVVDGDLAELRVQCERSDSPSSRVLLRGLKLAGASRVHMRESMEDGGRAELRRMRRNTGAIAAVATVAPLLGLLGTVVGMISTFQAVVESSAQGAGAVDVGQLADGIWQALVTTAAGQVVAIPVLLGHRYLAGRIDRLIGEIEDLAGLVVDRFAREEDSDEEPAA